MNVDKISVISNSTQKSYGVVVTLRMKFFFKFLSTDYSFSWIKLIGLKNTKVTATGSTLNINT